MIYGSVCSGIEAATVAWHPLGWKPAFFSEIEPFPRAVLDYHYPEVPLHGDFTTIKTNQYRPIDLLVGGTPCQSFSIAGLRGGLDDSRGNLALEFLKLAQRLRPRWVVWENVPGVLSSNGGRDFGSILAGLGEVGYGFAYRVLDAQWCRTHRHPRAVPQRRRRVFVVGCLGNPTSAAKVLFERESLQRYSAPRRATRQGTAADVAGCLRSGVDGGVPSSRGEHLVADVATVGALCARNYKGVGNQYVQENKCIPCWWDGDNTASTLTKSNANGAQRMPDKDNFGAVLQPVATPMLFENHLQDSRVTGPHDVAPSCVSQYGTDGGNVPLVIPIMPQAMQAEGWRVGKENQDGRGNGLGVGKDGDPCPTLDRSAVPAVAIQGTVIGRQDHNGPQGSGHSDSGEMFTLNSTDVHAVAVGCFKSGQSAKARSIGFSETESPTLGASGGNAIPAVAIVNMQGSKSNACVTDDGSSYTINAMHGHDVHAVAVAPTITATNDPSRSPQSSEITQQVAAVHASTMQVRRLTPTECERLQGFPDGWTAIPWKKKPADQCPDGPRYKALGNSMAVNCMEWLGERIQAVESGTL